MAFIRKNLSGNIGSGSTAPKIRSYISTTDAKAAVKGAGYFNDATQIMEKGDFIMAHCSDGATVLSVTSASGAASVTVIASDLA